MNQVAHCFQKCKSLLHCVFQLTSLLCILFLILSLWKKHSPVLIYHFPLFQYFIFSPETFLSRQVQRKSSVTHCALCCFWPLFILHMDRQRKAAAFRKLRKLSELLIFNCYWKRKRNRKNVPVSWRPKDQYNECL